MRGMIFCLGACAIACLASSASSQPYGPDMGPGYWTSLGNYSGTGSRVGGVGDYSAYIRGAAHLGQFATGNVMETYRDEQRDIDNGLYWEVAVSFEAQCDQNKIRASQMIFFDRSGHELFERQGPRGSDPGNFTAVTPGTLGEATYKFLCALPQGMVN